MGWVIGQILGRLAFRAPTAALRFAETAEALVALSAVFIAYGFAELVGGYGFLAVFCAAVTIRACEHGHEYHRVLHEFIGQIERLLTLALLLGFGYLVGGGLLAALTPAAAAWGILLALIVRPLTGWLAMTGSGMLGSERRTIAFFGVRGIGSFYYVAYAMTHAVFPAGDLIWATVAFAVLVSIGVHGVTASQVLRTLDRRAGRPTPETV